MVITLQLPSADGAFQQSNVILSGQRCRAGLPVTADVPGRQIRATAGVSDDLGGDAVITRVGETAITPTPPPASAAPRQVTASVIFGSKWLCPAGSVNQAADAD